MATAKKVPAKKAPAKKAQAQQAPAKKAVAKKKTTKGVAATASAAKKDATILLTRDHTEVHKLFKQYDKLAKSEAQASERKAIAERICLLLTVHAKAEEEIFYPAAREAGIEEDMMDEADIEHASAKDLIAQIQSMEPDDHYYDAKVKVLGEYIDHHVEEEEGEMFPKCRKARMDLAGLATRLLERKGTLMQELGAG